MADLADLHIHTQQPHARAGSPTPSASPTLLSSFGLDSSPSVASSATSTSMSTPIDGPADLPLKKRGYKRPQGTIFADSARNRDSVMSLGTIAHLQHYFARTGLLDGKGGRDAKDRKDGKPDAMRSASGTVVDRKTLFSLEAGSAASDAVSGTASPDLSFASEPSDEPFLLNMPPTYSTYRQRPTYVAPPPKLSVLRRELREALEDAKKVLAAQDDRASEEGQPSQGWFELDGLHILDLVTLAIKSAKNYYSSHDSPSRLYAIRSERQIRADLFRVLEVLKRVGSRNFAGGYRSGEVQDLLLWIAGIETLVTKDEAAEKKEQAHRESWLWLNGSCNGHEREREWVFLKSFEPAGAAPGLPPWSELGQDARPGPFLLALRDGIQLVRLHNELVKNSWRHFGEIKTWHTDTSKPYRCMENLRFWIRAAQLRWDVKLDVDVSAVVNDRHPQAWVAFDAAVLQWCRTVRAQMTAEWREHVEASGGRPATPATPGQLALQQASLEQQQQAQSSQQPQSLPSPTCTTSGALPTLVETRVQDTLPEAVATRDQEAKTTPAEPLASPSSPAPTAPAAAAPLPATASSPESTEQLQDPEASAETSVKEPETRLQPQSLLALAQ